MEIPDHVRQFVIAVRERAKQDDQFAPATEKSIQMLAGTMTKHLLFPRDRIVVLQAITKLPIRSSKMLTQQYVSVLIDEVINVCDEYPTTLQDIERLLESEAMADRAWELFPSKILDMPVLQAEDPGGSSDARSIDCPIESSGK
jgi:hypothetical protein